MLQISFLVSRGRIAVSRGRIRIFVFGVQMLDWTSGGEVSRGWFRLLIFEVSRRRIRNFVLVSRGWVGHLTVKCPEVGLDFCVLTMLVFPVKFGRTKE